MSKEKTIVKLLRSNKLLGQAAFTNYSTALKYATNKCGEGYTCLILRSVSEREWVKFYLTPPQNL